MNHDNRQSEDVAGLFHKFGGNAQGYKEFDRKETDARSGQAWPLVSEMRQAAGGAGPRVVAGHDRPANALLAPVQAPAAIVTAVSPVAPVARTPFFDPRPAPARPAAAGLRLPPDDGVPAATRASPRRPSPEASAFAPARLAAVPVVPAPAAQPDTAAPSELENLFARLAGPVPPPGAPVAGGLLSRWRKHL